MDEKVSLFVSCGSALEQLLFEELTELGVNGLQMGYRGVYVHDWNWSTIYTINYASRIASRVLLPLARFKCYDQKSLYQRTMQIDWQPFFHDSGMTLAIDANVQHRAIRNSLFAAQIVKDAICDQLRQKTGTRPSVDTQNPDIQLNLYVHNEMAVLSFDTSGVPLHKRGYRQEAVEAPIQETLAAAILRIAKYSAGDILLDPCCGSGTFLIEAALIASKVPPGYLRRQWGFMNHPDYSATEWLKVRNEFGQHRAIIPPKHIFGVDISKNAIRATTLNCKAAGFQKEIEIVQADFREFTPSIPPTIVVTNPPYGRRLEEEDTLKPIYRALGDFLKKKCPKSSRGFIFTGNLEMTKEIGLAAKRRYPLNNGGIESRLLEFEIF